MHFSNLPEDIDFAVAEQLGEESDINALSLSSRLHQVLNPFLYQYNIRHHNGWGMWRAIWLRCEAAVLKFILHGANVRAGEHVDEPFDRRYGEGPYSYSGDNNRPRTPSPDFWSPDYWRRRSELDRAQQQPQKEPPAYRRDPRQPPVLEAANVGHVGIMKLFLAHGANLDARDSSGTTPLMLAAMTNRHGKMVNFLLSLGVALNAYDELHTCALSRALELGPLEAAEILLAHPRINPDTCSANEQEQGIRNESPLIYAIRAE